MKAVRPARDHLEIQFPRVQGYRVELPEEKLYSQAHAAAADDTGPGTAV